MVRNTIGGSKHKSLARKSQVQHLHDDPIPDHEQHQYIAFVHKHFGNGICLVSLIDSIYSHTLHCHIRGKFTGKNKKHNLISTNSFIIVSLRPWENTPKNCDIICCLQGTYGSLGRTLPSDENQDGELIFSENADSSELTNYEYSNIEKQNKNITDEIEETEESINIDDI
jgi:hypothetical protein